LRPNKFRCWSPKRYIEPCQLYRRVHTGAIYAHEVKNAFEVVDQLTEKCGDIVFKKILPPEDTESLEQLALADAVASLQINIFLSYLRAATAVILRH
jgi:hypothetical protein